MSQKEYYKVYLKKDIIDHLKEGANFTGLSQGDFIANLLAMYEFRLRHAYKLSGVDLAERCRELDESFLRMLLVYDRDGEGFGLQEDGETSLLGEMCRNVGHNFRLRNKEPAVWGEPEIILPKDSKR